MCLILTTNLISQERVEEFVKMYNLSSDQHERDEKSSTQPSVKAKPRGGDNCGAWHHLDGSLQPGRSTVYTLVGLQFTHW